MSTFSRLYVQLIFIVKRREPLIQETWEEELFKYITGIITHKEQKLIVINGVPNHIHLLVGIKPTCKLSDLVREVKKASSVFIKEKGFSPYKFEWQEGYGAFSYSHGDLDNVVRYIEGQKEHHKRVDLPNEYKRLLDDFNIEIDTHYDGWITDS